MIAIFIEEVVTLNGEADVIDAIGNGINQGIAHGLHVAAIALDEVKTGFDPAFIIAMISEKIGIAIALDPLAELPQITAADPAIFIYACCPHRLEDQLIQPIRRIQPATNLRGRGAISETGIPAGRIHNSIQAGAGCGGITKVIVEPIRHVRHAGVGIAVFVSEASIGSHNETDVEDAIENCIDQVEPELCCVPTIVLHEVKARFHPTLIISVTDQERVEASLIATDPGVDRQNLTHLDPVGIGACPCWQGGQSREDELAEAIGSLGSPLDLPQLDRVGQTSIRQDRFRHPVEIGIGCGDIHPQRTQSFGHHLQRSVRRTVFVDKVACGIDLEAEMIDGIKNSIDEVAATKKLTRPIVHQPVEARLPSAFVLAVGGDERLQTGWIRAHPGVEGGQTFGEELIQRISGRDPQGQGGSIGGTAQAGITAQPADHLIETRAGGAADGAKPRGVANGCGGWCCHGEGRGRDERLCGRWT